MSSPGWIALNQSPMRTSGSTLCALSASSGEKILPPLQHRVALRLEFVARLPLWPLVCIRNPETDLEQELRVLGRAFERPVGLHLVGDLMVVMGNVVVHLLFPVVGRLPDEILP